MYSLPPSLAHIVEADLIIISRSDLVDSSLHNCGLVVVPLLEILPSVKPCSNHENHKC
jgi:hypothetical protein